MTPPADVFDARDAAIAQLSPSGAQLAELMEHLIRESAKELAYIRGKLKARADSPKGLSGRTLVEWHKAEGMAMARAQAIKALQGQQAGPMSYEALIQQLEQS